MGRISMPQGKGSQMHNRRDYEKMGLDIPGNINQDKIKDNVVLVDTDVKEAYQKIFGEAVEQYNAKQKRADRKIDNYYDKIEHSKNGEKVFYEDVLQWGKKEDFDKHPELREKALKALQIYAATFQERNPNLVLIGAYIHLDEASPHLHLDYIPIASGYKQGMSLRNSLDKALEQQGVEIAQGRKRMVKNKETGEIEEVELKEEGRFNNRTMTWKEQERAYFGFLCQELGLELEEEQHLGRKQLTVAEYKEAMRHLDSEKEKLRSDIDLDYFNLQKIKGEIGTLKVQKQSEINKVNETVDIYNNNKKIIDEQSKQIEQNKTKINEQSKQFEQLSQDKKEFEKVVQEAVEEQTLFLKQIDKKINEKPKADEYTLNNLDNLILKVEKVTNKPLNEKGNQTLALKPETWQTVLKTLKTIKGILTPLIQIKQKIEAQIRADMPTKENYQKRKSIIDELIAKEEQASAQRQLTKEHSHDRTR